MSTETNNMTFNAEDLTNRSNENAKEIQEKRKQERDARFKERNDRLTAFITQDFDNLVAIFNEDSVAGAIESAVDRGHDSLTLRNSKYYVPRFADIEGNKTLITPPESTYAVAPEQEKGVPFATIRRGIYNRKTHVSNPSKLPGGKTSIQLFSEYLGDNGGLFAVQRHLRDRIEAHGRTWYVPCTVIDIVWDMENYEERMRRRTEAHRRRRAQHKSRPTESN